jgi:putative ABC transport system substrate-binding protein
MRRRDILGLLGGVAVAWPVGARAQQGALPVVGFLNSETPQLYARFVDAFQQGLKELAFVDGQNVVIQYYWAGERYDLLPALASDLVRRNVAVIVANPPSVLPAKAATTIIPILFVTSLDPVEAGIVNSLNRPGGNLTGITSLNVEVAPKRLEILHELLPAARVIGALVNPAGPNAEAQSQNLAAAAHSLGVQLQIVHATTEAELDTAVAEMGQDRSGRACDQCRSALR